jgi:hypothetical protein
MMPFSSEDLKLRLYEEYQKHKALFIAFDFDNTIFDYHNSGRDFHDVITLLKRCSEQGHKMILFSSNEDPERINFMCQYCRHFGIRIDYVNENPIVCRGCRKPYYNILLDDRAGLTEAFDTLLDVVIQIEKEKNNETTDTEPAAQ